MVHKVKKRRSADSGNVLGFDDVQRLRRLKVIRQKIQSDQSLKKLERELELLVEEALRIIDAHSHVIDFDAQVIFRFEMAKGLLKDRISELASPDGDCLPDLG